MPLAFHVEACEEGQTPSTEMQFDEETKYSEESRRKEVAEMLYEIKDHRM